MHWLEFLSKADSKFRPYFISLFPFRVSAFFYSNARKIFLSQFSNANFPKIQIPVEHNVRLWDIDFNCAVFNAAGMFKNAEAYNVVANMGAGAFLAGTTTYKKRNGNRKLGINNPFIPYPHSAASSNWMGLPNQGHQTIAKIISNIPKIKLCPIGVSLAESPETLDEIEKVNELIDGMWMYEKAGVDFIELNFSCPNVVHNYASNTSLANSKCTIEQATITKLSLIADKFLSKRQRKLPVIAKYSNDITAEELLQIIDLLLELKFDGINLGNTSTKYAHYFPLLNPKDAKIYKNFTQKFGGGLSGNILKDNSLALCQLASNHLKTKTLTQEFHCIRTGGVASGQDLLASQCAGIALNQWFTGFFDAFACDGFKVYHRLLTK